MHLKSIWLRLWAKIGPRRGLRTIPVDHLPEPMPARQLVATTDDGDDWSVGMRCPCGCGRTIELLLIEEAEPRWKLTVESDGRPTLSPSVWLKDGCKSHFWLRGGRVEWCD